MTYPDHCPCLFGPPFQKVKRRRTSNRHVVSILLKVPLAFLVISSLFPSYCSGQKIFRRHFLIAYDVSGPFVKAEKENPHYKQALVDLFSNKKVQFYSDDEADNLNVEQKNGLPFFDKDKDEISFYHFNIAAPEMKQLQYEAATKQESEVIASFNNLFLKNKNDDWSVYHKRHAGGDVTGYVDSLFNYPPSPSYFGNGVSMSNFVYPLILNHVDGPQFAEEYIVIILSDFLTGSSLGNKKDLDRVRDIFEVSYASPLYRGAPVYDIKDEIDRAGSRFFKIDYFEYAFTSGRSNNAIAIIGYKIKPDAGKVSPEDLSLFVDGDLRLSQKGYQSTDFRLYPTLIKFTHNNALQPVRLRMEISLEKGGRSSPIFIDTIAVKDARGAWHSVFTGDEQVMHFDSARLTYYLPALDVTMDPAINQRDFSNLKVTYAFDVHYLSGNGPPLNLIYITERNFPVNNIDYSTKATIIIMYIAIPVIALISVVFALVVYGKPKYLEAGFDGFLDSLEKIDYRDFGKLHTPYEVWNAEESPDYLKFDLSVGYNADNFIFNWQPLVLAELVEARVPDGFEIFMKTDFDNIREYGPGTIMPIQKKQRSQRSIIVGIRQRDTQISLEQPELVSFFIRVTIRESRLLIKAEQSLDIKYKFHIGPDLEDVWVSFDPGTSGSCVAVGSATENIMMSVERRGTQITDSKLVFITYEDLLNYSGDIPSTRYLYGSGAYNQFGNEDVMSFQSIKKLIGFKDTFNIKFKNGRSLDLTGKDLASLLVKCIYNDLLKTVNASGIKTEDYFRKGIFNPLRAVVAIPNNFTISKIQEMIDCIKNLGQFREIRYVYEAEAILFYYLSNFSKFNESARAIEDESILVFDMGGATINTTVVNTNKVLVNGRDKYEINYLGKIGYGIGGDAIDYCLCKFILNYATELGKTEDPDNPDKNVLIKDINLFKDKNKLSKFAYEVKTEIIRNFNNPTVNVLISEGSLERAINKNLSVKIKITPESHMLPYFRKDDKNNYPLFAHTIFTKTIYNNISDAVREVMDLSDNIYIDKIIFSGRSTAFPLIKETVRASLKNKNTQIKIIELGLEESKTAVAKGACWYGINKNAVILNNLKTNASFGFKKTHSPDRTDVQYHELVKMGSPFDSSNEDVDYASGEAAVNDDFAFDGSKVNYIQVMGKDAVKILANQQTHKYSKIASIILPQPATEIAIEINENDQIECLARLLSSKVLTANGVVTDQDIRDANDEHYTWILSN